MTDRRIKLLRALLHTDDTAESMSALAEDLDGDELPPLTRKRPPKAADIHRDSIFPESLREAPPFTLYRPVYESPETDIEVPVFSGAKQGPCYVPDRTGHEEYAYTGLSREVRRELRKRDTQVDED